MSVPDVNTVLVSVCIPTYNGAEYLSEALNSVKAQTFKEFEVIISDDASKDNTLDIVEDFKNSVDFPVTIFNHEPQGIGANWNNCIRHAKGKYIKFLFQDDVLAPHCIEVMVNVLENNSKLGLVSCKRSFIVEPSYLNSTTKEWIQNFEDLQRGLEFSWDDGVMLMDKSLFKSPAFFKSPLNKIGEPSLYMFPKRVVNTIGYFREDLKQVLDYEFCYRLLKRQNIAILKEELVSFRLHKMQATNINRTSEYDDYTIYNSLLEKDYLWYFSRQKQVAILRKRYPLFNYLFKIKRKIGL